MPTDDELRTDPDAPRDDVGETARRHAPVPRGAGAGRTNTGAIEPLDAIADVATPRTCGSTSTAPTEASPTHRPGPRCFHGIERGESATPTRTRGCSSRTGPVASCRDGVVMRDARLRGRGVPLGHAADGRAVEVQRAPTRLSRDRRGLRVGMRRAGMACGRSGPRRTRSSTWPRPGRTTRCGRSEDRDRLAAPADGGAVPDARRGRDRQPRLLRGSTRRSACSCRARRSTTTTGPS